MVFHSRSTKASKKKIDLAKVVAVTGFLRRKEREEQDGSNLPNIETDRIKTAGFLRKNKSNTLTMLRSPEPLTQREDHLTVQHLTSFVVVRIETNIIELNHSHRVLREREEQDPYNAQLKPYLLNAGIVLLVGVYVYAGALLIQFIERVPVRVEESSRVRRDNENDMPIIAMDRSKECVLQALRRIVVNSNGNCTHVQKNMSLLDACYASDLRKLDSVYEATPTEEEPKEPALKKYEIVDGYEQWTTTDAILFCFTVITTIGYGNVAPQSFWGRVFVIIYGTIGIPTAMMAIANVGKFLATLLKTWTRPFLLLCRRVKRKMHRKEGNTGSEVKETQRLMESSKRKAKKIEDDISSHEDEEADEDVEESDVTETIVLFVAFLIYIIAGSLLMSYYEEGMTFGLAIYFNFVTLTTIGLGDLVPQSTDWLFVTLIYCAIGLALTTIAIEIAADTLKKLHYFGRKLDNVQNVQIWFGGQK
uniref:Potassium channel domain-containing protein n=1 Tax=Caenorhabditis japonica TaxID=281687 RepID=A0A8R1DG05_CAEJA